jgi:hypothetical protein
MMATPNPPYAPPKTTDGEEKVSALDMRHEKKPGKNNKHRVVASMAGKVYERFELAMRD